MGKKKKENKSCRKFFSACSYSLILEEEKEPNYLSAGVGEYAVFNCDLDFPHETPIPYILQWNRDVSIIIVIIISLQGSLIAENVVGFHGEK